MSTFFIFKFAPKAFKLQFGVGAAAVGTALAAGFLYSKQAEPIPLDSLAEIKDATVIFVLGGPGKF